MKIFKYSRPWPPEVKLVINLWKGIIIENYRQYIQSNQEPGAETMYRYLETFLGETTKALWKAYKTEFLDDFQGLVNIRANPYNFANKLHSLITRKDPNSGSIFLQKSTLIKLE